MESLFASRTVRRFGKWIVSLVAGGATVATVALGRVTYGWFESRASTYTLASEIAQHAAVVNEVKRLAYHGASLSDDNARQLMQLWQWQVAAQAELVVYRAYSRAEPARRGELIEKAKRFYALEWDSQRKAHANDLAEAARLTMLKEWRP